MSRYGSVNKLGLTLAMFIIFGVAAGTAKADIVVITGVNNQGTDNVLLNPATNVTTVTGTVGQNNLLVNFTSSSGSGLLNSERENTSPTMPSAAPRVFARKKIHAIRLIRIRTSS